MLSQIRIDCKRAIVFVHQKRASEWTENGDQDKLAISKVGPQAAGIEVDPDKICDAVVVLMQQHETADQQVPVQGEHEHEGLLHENSQ